MSAAQLAPEAIQASPVNGRAVFVVATPETGAERFVRALAAMPGVASMGVPTHLFSQGIGLLLDTWLTRTRDAFGERADDARFLADVRQLGDAPLRARLEATGAERIVEYSPDHISLVGIILTLYPDAHVVHVVRDGREVARRLTSPLFGWPPFEAARRWCSDQQAVCDLGDVPNLHVVRMEDLVEDGEWVITEVATRLGLSTNDDAVAAATGCVGPSLDATSDIGFARTATLVDVLGAESLAAYGYAVDDHSALERAMARAALTAPGEVAWAVRSAVRRAIAAWRED